MNELQASLADTASAEALRAMAPHAPTLAVETAALLSRRVLGEWLTPDDETRALHGLLVCSVAQRAELFGPWMDFLGADDVALASILGSALAPAATTITLSLFPHGDAAATAALIERIQDPGGHPEVRRGLWRALARLLADGMLPRPRVLSAFEAFAQATPEPEAAAAFAGWAEAMALLGYERHRALFADALSRAAEALGEAAPDAATLLALHEHAQHEEGATLFEAAGIAPVKDAAAARDALWPESEAPEGLSSREFGWLDDFLASGEAGEDAFDLEAADGFFCALAIGPAPLSAEAAVAAVLGAEDATPAIIAARRLLMARYNSVVTGWLENEPPPPLLLEGDPSALGAAWCWGFLEAVGRQGEAWDEIARDARADPALAGMESLTSEELTRSERRALLQKLPDCIETVERFWRDPSSRQSRAPVKVVKVGRNDPCPCGSGKKHKQCCLNG